MTLTDFLLARITEDEEIARDESDGYELRFDEYDPTDFQNRFPPARVLAECDAKRRIVTGSRSECSDYGAPGTERRIEGEEIADSLGLEYQPHWPDAYAPFCDGCAAAESADRQQQWVLRLLALPYADHPDYQPEWEP